MYKYGNIEEAKAGDLVEYTRSHSSMYIRGQLYIVKSFDIYSIHQHIYTENGDNTHRNFRLVLTAPGSTAKVGDSVIMIEDMGGVLKRNTIHTLESLSNGSFVGHSCVSSNPDTYLVLLKEEEYGEGPAYRRWFQAQYGKKVYKFTSLNSNHNVDGSGRYTTLKHTASTQDNKKETKMNENITVTMAAKEFAKHQSMPTPKVKTDFEARFNFSVTYYNEDGSIFNHQEYKTAKLRNEAALDYLADAKAGARAVPHNAGAAIKRKAITVVEA